MHSSNMLAVLYNPDFQELSSQYMQTFELDLSQHHEAQSIPPDKVAA